MYRILSSLKNVNHFLLTEIGCNEKMFNFHFLLKFHKTRCSLFYINKLPVTHLNSIWIFSFLHFHANHGDIFVVFLNNCRTITLVLLMRFISFYHNLVLSWLDYRSSICPKSDRSFKTTQSVSCAKQSSYFHVFSFSV